MTGYVDTKHVAAELRRRLKDAFPGVTFSVCKGTGTSSAWIDVDWTDGPPTADVKEITRLMQGWDFSAMEDRYACTGNTVTAPVDGWRVTGTPRVEGSIADHTISEDALTAAALWSDAHDGAKPASGDMHAAFVIDGHVIRDKRVPRRVRQIAEEVVLPKRWTAAQKQATGPDQPHGWVSPTITEDSGQASARHGLVLALSAVSGDDEASAPGPADRSAEVWNA
ncbi:MULTISPECIES: LPD29 domain-containing protein [unclassified Streptomyces]|uniref:LPD29 domain-containing protein n=1 Tax=unclassified Streptomyces TaxID=2593676 RepID=UPI002DDBB633|nr:MULTISPECIES: LPD29 domain-containing protein [unclassified Streptomyces]WSF81761.1 hypothetical protein OIE70_00195 [Streptomyces sp. NBC_01744]WSC34128.1 hypothetical protein OHA08_00185 [Streptomyces sp. NBC_01763]WSC41930.1 hypothetical protein OHA08_44795 [Streptomyces sp. NBC_01763]WSC50926.1 hypothetical protein OG808_00185 [Streptomyces sp. NBC_01761]WSC58595.1 hypothetical protein OG808_44130 [Streptomyces sp. NBC_01761]